MLRRGSFTGTQRKTNQLKQVVGAPKPASSRLRILSQGTSRCARHFFPLPLLLASSARRLTRERSLEDPRNGQRKAVGFCRVSNPLRSKTLLSHGLAPLKLTVSDSLKLSGGRHDQILRTIIPRTSLHCRYFRASARHQRPHVRVRVAWRHRLHCGLLRDPDVLHHPFSVLQALSDPWQQQQTKELSTRRPIIRLRGGGFYVRGLANYRSFPRPWPGVRSVVTFLGGGARCRREANSRSDRYDAP